MARSIIVFALIALTSVGWASVVNRSIINSGALKQSQQRILNPADEKQGHNCKLLIKRTLNSRKLEISFDHKEQSGFEMDSVKALKVRHNSKVAKEKNTKGSKRKRNYNFEDFNEYDEIDDEEEELENKQSNEKKKPDNDEYQNDEVIDLFNRPFEKEEEALKKKLNKEMEDDEDDEEVEDEKDSFKKQQFDKNGEDVDNEDAELKDKQNDEKLDDKKTTDKPDDAFGNEEDEEENTDEEDGENKDKHSKAKKGISSTNCDSNTPKISCADCSTILVCKPSSGKLIACIDPVKPYCNDGMCSNTTSDRCLKGIVT